MLLTQMMTRSFVSAMIYPSFYTVYGLCEYRMTVNKSYGKINENSNTTF